MDEHPLHVRVAEAFGWTALRTQGQWKYWIGTPPNMPPRHTAVVPLFDSDWRLAGALIAKHGMTVGPLYGPDGNPSGRWRASVGQGPNCPEVHGATPLVAVCAMLLSLDEAGRL